MAVVDNLEDSGVQLLPKSSAAATVLEKHLGMLHPHF